MAVERDYSQLSCREEDVRVSPIHTHQDSFTNSSHSLDILEMVGNFVSVAKYHCYVYSIPSFSES
jgi:hypothetical protein